MARDLKGEKDSRRDNQPRLLRAVDREQLAAWLDKLSARLKPNVYVDASDVPDPPESPYRARLPKPPEQPLTDVEVGEREVVRGEIRIVYEVHCACGKRWFNPTLLHVQLCPRCGCAVLLQPPAESIVSVAR